MPVIEGRSPQAYSTPSGVGPPPAKLSTATLHLSLTIRRPVKLRNVAGLLRGSDPALKDTCVMVTAHYDHVGVRGPEGTDRIYNGANDDGSGTVSVVEIASALASLKERPKRSILFVTFFGEEKGLLGSRYYGKNPIFPVEKTVADVNLEQVGRTDDSEGPQVGTARMTGHGYSDVSKVFIAAGDAEGVKVLRHPRTTATPTSRASRQSGPRRPRRAGPHAVRGLRLSRLPRRGRSLGQGRLLRHGQDRPHGRPWALLTLADDPNEPKWDESNPKAAKYLKAWKERRGR